MTIKTTRLKIYTATQEEMIRIIDSQPDDVLRKAYQEMLQGCLDHPQYWVWYVIWIIEFFKISDRYLYLELGVGANTPVIIKYPFWQMTFANDEAVYACINYGEAFCPGEIEDRSICIDGDIGEIIR